MKKIVKCILSFIKDVCIVLLVTWIIPVINNAIELMFTHWSLH